MGSEANDEMQVPLLADKMLYPNCPGCKCAHLSAKGAGPPVKHLFMVASVVLCNALPISSLLAYLYFMIDDFHIAKRKEDIGCYAGAIVSIFMVGRVVSSVIWGKLADKYGRKIVFYAGLLSIIVLQPIFGASKNYWIAFLARFLLGVFNGMVGPLKAYCSEICSAESQAWGLNVVNTSWSFGLIIGPALGGFFARPVINFPGIFSQVSIFASYPYLLPSLIQAVFAAAVLVVVYCLPESIHKHGKERSADIEESLIKSVKPKGSSLWLNMPLMAGVAVYCLWSMHDTSFNEIFAMWCVSPLETGGLALQTSNVGTILAVSGFGMVCAQLAIFPYLAKRVGPISVTRVPAILAVPLVLLFPFIPLLHGRVEWVSVTLLALVRNVLSANVITGTFLLVNNAVSTEHRGAANGIALCCESVFKAIGPTAGGAIFAWGQSRHTATFLPGSQLVFVILAVLAGLGVLATMPLFLPKYLNEPYSEELEEQYSQASNHHDDKKKVAPLQ